MYRTQIEAQIRRRPQFAPGFLIQEGHGPDRGRIAIHVEMALAWCTACAEERLGYVRGLQEAVEACIGVQVTVHLHGSGALRNAVGEAAVRSTGKRMPG